MPDSEGPSPIHPIPVHLPSPLEDAIRNHARAEYPHECCGILFGTDTKTLREIKDVQKAANAFDVAEVHHRFTIAPEALLAAERYASEKGLSVLGFYHSHPDHPAIPSEYDREHAWPFYSYIIVSLSATQITDITSSQLDAQTEHFAREELIVT